MSLPNLTRINEHCRNISRIFGQTEPLFTDGSCSFCGSVTATYLEAYLEDGGEISWIEPLVPPFSWQSAMVEGVNLANGKKFMLTHLWDEPLTEVDEGHINQLLEDNAGNLRIYLRELNKYDKYL